MNQIEVSPFNKISLNRGTHFVMMHLENIPPHLGLIIHGDFFSISTRNKAISIPVMKLLGKIIRREIPTIFVEISDIGEKETMIDYLSEMPLVSENGTNCIDPIIHFAEFNGIKIDNQKHISDFLEQVTIINSMSLFAEGFTSHGKYAIPLYTTREIQKLIKNHL